MIEQTIRKNENASMLILTSFDTHLVPCEPSIWYSHVCIHPHTDTTSFSKEVHVETSLYDDGTVREAEITFTVSVFFSKQDIRENARTHTHQPPRLCVFQRASYILVISGGNRMWSHTKYPVAITDFLQPIEEELETGFSLFTLYTANVTVFTKYANISSTADFSVCYFSTLFSPHATAQ